MNQQLIKELFTYKDGELWWKKQPCPFYDMSKPAGKRSQKQHSQIMINNKSYGTHRLIWMYHYGDIPKDLIIDHINRNPVDNRIENLRVTTQAINGLNRGSKGYHKTKQGKYRVHTKVNGVYKHIGIYGTECAAKLIAMFYRLERNLQGI